MFEKIPPIYRKLIYEYLDTKDLIFIGKTCKCVYIDENRISAIIEKISCTFGYKTDPCFLRIPFLFDMMPSNILNPIRKEFEKRMLSLKFSDIDKLSLEDVRNLTITFPFDLFFSLEINAQEKLIFVLCEHSYQICEYEEVNQFVLEPFYVFIIDTLCKIFKEGSSIRIFVMDNLIKFNNKQLQRDVVKDFILGLFRGDITQLELMIEIGLFFWKNFPYYLKQYIEDCFEGYVVLRDEYEDTGYDIHAETLENVLNRKNKFFPELSNAQVLDNILSESKIFSVSMIRAINKRRHLRYIRQYPR